MWCIVDFEMDRLGSFPISLVEGFKHLDGGPRFIVPRVIDEAKDAKGGIALGEGSRTCFFVELWKLTFRYWEGESLIDFPFLLPHPLLSFPCCICHVSDVGMKPKLGVEGKV